MRKSLSAALIVPLVCMLLPASAAEKRVYIAPDDHTDYWWTGDEERYQVAFLATLDYYLDRADETEGSPSEFQSRWNCDGSFWVWTYEKNRSPEAFARLVERIRDGHISVPLNALCVSIGGVPVEAVIRGSYYPGKLERKHGIRFRLAYTMENQTQPLGLWSVWHGCGARYSWKGICNCDTRTPQAGNRRHEIYRAVGLDGRSMLVKWNSMLVNNRGMGGYAEARDPAAIVDFVTTDAAANGFLARYPYDVIGCFGKGWDDLMTTTMEFVTVAQSMTTATRKVIVSNEEDFFLDFEKTHGASLPSETCSYGNEWDLYCAALAEVSARVKRSVEKLRAAEAMAAVAFLFDPSFPAGREEARDRAWMDLGLYWEHNFGMVTPPTGAAGVAGRIEWQRRLAAEIESYVDGLHADAASRLGDLIPSGTPSGDSGPRVFAFNPLSWTRTDVAQVPWPEAGPVRVVDLETGEDVRSQLVTLDGQRVLRFLASGVPPVGYRVYEVRSGAGTSFPDAARVSEGWVLENALYRVTVGQDGAITSLLDLGRGGGEIVREGESLNDLGSGAAGSVAVEETGPVAVTLRAESPGPPSHVSRITLLHGVDRVEIRNEITQNFDDVRTWDFFFGLESPETHHEEVGAILRAGLEGEGGHYASRNARYDWLTLNHFADMTGAAGAGVTLSNADCYFMRLGESTITELDTATPRIRVLAGGRVANRENGLPGQGGDTRFLQRFALRAHGAHDAAAAMRFALEHQNPLVCGRVSGGRAALPSGSFSMVTLAGQDVLLWALKPAEEGTGIVARLWNLSSSPREAALQLAPRPVKAAVEVSHIETDERSLAVGASGARLDMAGQEIRTVRLVVSGEETSLFERGNCNADGVFDISDAIGILLVLFAGVGSFLCEDACDIDDNGAVDVSDAIYSLRHQFQGGPAPRPPFPGCGSDPTEDSLGCLVFPRCAGG